MRISVTPLSLLTLCPDSCLLDHGGVATEAGQSGTRRHQEAADGGTAGTRHQLNCDPASARHSVTPHYTATGPHTAQVTRLLTSVSTSQCPGHQHPSSILCTNLQPVKFRRKQNLKRFGTRPLFKKHSQKQNFYSKRLLHLITRFLRPRWPSAQTPPRSVSAPRWISGSMGRGGPLASGVSP